MLDSLRFLAGFYWEPSRTASDLLDRGSWWASVVLAGLVCVPFILLMAGGALWLAREDVVYDMSIASLWTLELLSSPLRLALLAGAFAIPTMTAVGTFFGRHTGSFGTVLRRDFGAAFTGLLTAFAASHLPVALAALWVLTQPPAQRLPAAALLGKVWFLSLGLLVFFLMFIARAIWGLSPATSALAALAGLAALFLGLLTYPLLRPLLWFLGSPFLLFFLWNAAQSDLSAIGNAFRSRGNLRRQLDAAALNPHDADAQYQIGLILAERRQFSEAQKRFASAAQIDPTFAEAHYELGRIAREQKRLPEAIEHLGRAVALNDKLSQHEIWREIGATYRDAGMREDAESALRKYVERREHDPHGLYLLGDVVTSPEEARTLFLRAVEATLGAPPHRQRELRYWANLARKRL